MYNQANIKYLLSALLRVLRYRLLLTPSIWDKILICNAIQDCTIPLGEIHQINNSSTLSLTRDIPTDFDVAVRSVAKSPDQDALSLSSLLGLIDGQSTYLRGIYASLSTLVRRSVESAASALHISAIIPIHIQQLDFVVSHPTLNELPWPEIPTRPAREASKAAIETRSSPEQTLQRLYDQIFGIEIPAAEVCAAIPLRFTTIPEELDFTLARQTYEEGRHARLLLDAFLGRGGDTSDYEPTFRIWDNMQCGQSLNEALCIEHVLGEGYALGHDLQCIDDYRAQKISDLMDIHISLHEDEMMHVSDGLRWFNRLSEGLSNEFIERLESSFAVIPPPEPWFREDLRRVVGFTEHQIARQRKLLESNR